MSSQKFIRKRAGVQVRLRQDCKNFAGVTAQSRQVYDEIEQRQLTEAKARIFSFADGILCNDDAKHNTIISEAEITLPQFNDGE